MYYLFFYLDCVDKIFGMGTYLKRNYKTLKKTGGNAEKIDAYWLYSITYIEHNFD